jgi:hypothetical protein
MPASHGSSNGGARSSRAVGVPRSRDGGQAARAGDPEGMLECLTVAVGKLRHGATALKAENRELRAEIAGLEREGGGRRSGDAPIRELTSAELLVTNSLDHGELGDGDSVLVSVYLATDRLRLEIQGPGTAGVVAASRAGRESGQGGFGLDLVDLLAARWGVVRNRDTSVWFELARA